LIAPCANEFRRRPPKDFRNHTVSQLNYGQNAQIYPKSPGVNHFTP